VAARLVAAEVAVDPYSLYNAYRLLLIHEDPAALERADRQEHVRTDPKLRGSLLVLDSYDFPYVTRDTAGLERLAERVRPAAAELRLSPDQLNAIAVAAGDELLGAERAAREVDLHEGAAYIRKHVWPRLQLYRRQNQRNPGWTYLARRSELERVVSELKVGDVDEEAEREARQAWAGLNPRQQDYLVAAYRIQRQRPRAWIRYGYDEAGLPTELRSAIRRARARDPGTGSTWNALEARALLECRYVLPDGFDESQLEVRLTRPGHLAARIGQGEAERQLRERQHELLNRLEVIIEYTQGWGANLHKLCEVLAEVAPEDVTDTAARLLTAKIEPRVRRVEADLAGIRLGLARLREASHREQPAPTVRRSRRRGGSPTGAEG
jgi:hypothetical protein